MTIENNFLDNKEDVYINEKLITDNNFKETSQLDKDILAKKGFYCIRLKEKSKEEKEEVRKIVENGFNKIVSLKPVNMVEISEMLI